MRIHIEEVRSDGGPWFLSAREREALKTVTYRATARIGGRRVQRTFRMPYWDAGFDRDGEPCEAVMKRARELLPAAAGRTLADNIGDVQYD